MCVFVGQVAVMSGNFELGEIIKNHRDTDVGKSLRSGLILHASFGMCNVA